MPRKVVAKVRTSMAGRKQKSTRQSIAYAAQMIKARKGKVSDFAISKRKNVEEELATKLMEKFRNDSNNHFLIIHWDGKKVKLRDTTVEEHVAIFLQSVMSGRPPYFVGAPQLPDITGMSMKDAIVHYVTRHGLAENMDKFIGMGFDTTAANTGVNNGAASLLEIQLDKALLWFACRHHIAELHINSADDAVRHPKSTCDAVTCVLSCEK